MSNLSRLLDKFKNNFPDEFKPKVDIIEKYAMGDLRKIEFIKKMIFAKNDCGNTVPNLHRILTIIALFRNSLQKYVSFLKTF